MTKIEQKKRISVILDDLAIEPWQKSIFDAIEDPARFEVIIVKKPNSDVAAKPQTGHTGLNVLSRAVDRFEKTLSTQLFAIVFGTKRGGRNKAVDFYELDSRPRSWDRSLHNHGEITELDQPGLDLVLDLSRTPDPDRLSHKARLGYWYLTLGETPLNAAPTALAGFKEVSQNIPNIETELRIKLPEQDATITLKKGCFRTFLWSWNENERQLRYKAAAMITDALDDLAHKPDFALPAAGANITQSNAVTTQSAPGPAAMVFATTKCMWRIVKETLTRVLTNEKWSLHIAEGSNLDADLTKSQAIEPPANSYWADPFFFERDGKTFIFFEEYLYPKSKGVISVAEFTENHGQWRAGDAEIIIETDYHMSYPFMFEFGDELYMVPESNADNCIGLWRCKSFPHDWQKVSNLIDDISATDTTLHFQDGKWWMFTNIDRTGLGDHCSELHIFYADDPTGNNWTPHPANPVVRDARCARMAGPLLNTDDNKLIRPAQINERYYGHALALYEITKLDCENYEEVLKRRIDPDWRTGIYRNHHISGASGHVVVDACRDQYKFENLFKPAITKPSTSYSSQDDKKSNRTKPKGQLLTEHAG